MNPRDIIEIKEAEDLLRLARKDFPSAASANRFREAFEILNDYLYNFAPSEKIARFIQRLKFAYARFAIKKLNEINAKDIHIYDNYFVLFLTEIR